MRNVPHARGRALVIIISLCLALIFTAAHAETLGIASYKTPPGFTSSEMFDNALQRYQLTLTDSTNNVTMGFVASHYFQFEGFDMTSISQNDVPQVLSILGIDAQLMGLTAEIVTDMDEETSQVYAYIIMHDASGRQSHLINIDSRGWAEYELLIRRDSQLTDYDYDLYFEFYSSIVIIES